MTTDAELAAAIEAEERNPKKKAKAAPAPQPLKIDGDPKRIVPVRCVVHSEPWDSEKALKYWEIYEITYEDAVLLESRHFVVILQAPQTEGE